MRGMELVSRKRFAAYLAAHPCRHRRLDVPDLDGALRAHAPGRDAEDARRRGDHRPRGAALLGVVRGSTCTSSRTRSPSPRCAAGPGRTRASQAVHGLTSDPRFTDPPERNVAREELGLSTRGSLVVVSGGGWGVGDLRGATDTALHYSAGTVVVLVGSNETARARMEEAYGDNERVQIWGFTDKMLLLLAAADVLIHATAGLTVLEALMCDTRVISYGWPRGHIRFNNRAYERLGMVAVAKTRPQLAHALVHAINAPPLGPQLPELPAAADLVLGMAEREPAHAG